MKHVYELEVLFWEIKKTLKDQLYSTKKVSPVRQLFSLESCSITNFVSGDVLQHSHVILSIDHRSGKDFHHCSIHDLKEIEKKKNDDCLIRVKP